jgi:hypothetical protein
MFKLLQTDKNADDQTMKDACYAELQENQPAKLQKVKVSKGGWDRYWDEVVQSDVSQFFSSHYH